jgi:hypothetical protein
MDSRVSKVGGSARRALAARESELRIEQDPQFHGHYMCAFGSLEVMLAGRAYLAQEAAAALR